jgi:MOSC domain-containing protein
MPEVARISVTPVKGFLLAHPEEVQITEHGAAGDRLFSLVWEDGTRVRSSLNAWHNLVNAVYDAEAERLTIRFPDGVEVSGDAVATGDELDLRLDEGTTAGARVVDGPWAEPLSVLAERPVRLVRTAHPNEIKDAPVSLVSQGSLARVSREAGRDVDARRFRMLFEIAGCSEHEEDGWVGRAVRVGGAVIEVAAHDVRCAVTTRDPDTAQRDLDTLGLLAGYRGKVTFGVLADVVEPGRVRVGDEVVPL